jgi:hypothetical protein
MTNETDQRKEAKKLKYTDGSTKFNPVSHNPIPWKVVEKDLWHAVVASNGKTVCSCRNILDAKLIVERINN